MGDLSPRAKDALAGAAAIACEDTRRTGRLLKHAGITPSRLLPVHEHNEASMVDSILAVLTGGGTVALVSDAGMPVISDPGARVVQAVVAAGFDVTVVPGPSAAVSAVAVSGLPADRWVFEGFLPRKGAASRLAEVAAETRTVVLYEAPHRLRATLAALAKACGATRPVALVRELTKLHEEIWRGTLGEAVALYADRAPRGEYVLVLGGAPLSTVDDELIVGALAEPGATVASVAANLRVPKNRVYGVAVRSRQQP